MNEQPTLGQRIEAEIRPRVYLMRGDAQKRLRALTRRADAAEALALAVEAVSDAGQSGSEDGSWHEAMKSSWDGFQVALAAWREVDR